MDAQPSRGLLDDPISFWEERHARLDEWRSGGDRGLTPEENFEFYTYRIGRIVEFIRRHLGGERPLRILDAGCGRGHMTDALRRCGHLVTGIDSSRTAVAWATKTYGRHFEHCQLASHRPGAPYDVILCIDVTFHLLDDATWRAGLAAFGRYAAAESLLLLTDAFGQRRSALSDYILHRSRVEYERELGALGFRIVDLVPYAFGSNPNQFAVCLRGI